MLGVIYVMRWAYEELVVELERMRAGGSSETRAEVGGAGCSATCGAPLST